MLDFYPFQFVAVHSNLSSLHAIIHRSGAFWCYPIDVLRHIFNVASFTMNAIKIKLLKSKNNKTDMINLPVCCIDLKFHSFTSFVILISYELINSSWTVS